MESFNAWEGSDPLGDIHQIYNFVLTLTPDYANLCDVGSPKRTVKLTREDSTATIGRASKSSSRGLRAAADNLLFECPVISRHHAKITADFNTMSLTIKDTGSIHGTHIFSTYAPKGWDRIESNVPRKVVNGDRVQFGTLVWRGAASYFPVSLKLAVGYEIAMPVPPTPTLRSTYKVYSDIDESADDDSIIEVSGPSIPGLSKKAGNLDDRLLANGQPPPGSILCGMPARPICPAPLIDTPNPGGSQIVDLTQESSKAATPQKYDSHRYTWVDVVVDSVSDHEADNYLSYVVREGENTKKAGSTRSAADDNEESTLDTKAKSTDHHDSGHDQEENDGSEIEVDDDHEEDNEDNDNNDDGSDNNDGSENDNNDDESDDDDDDISVDSHGDSSQHWQVSREELLADIDGYSSDWDEESPQPAEQAAVSESENAVPDPSHGSEGVASAKKELESHGDVNPTSALPNCLTLPAIQSRDQKSPQIVKLPAIASSSTNPVSSSTGEMFERWGKADFFEAREVNKSLAMREDTTKRDADAGDRPPVSLPNTDKASVEHDHHPEPQCSPAMVHDVSLSEELISGKAPVPEKAMRLPEPTIASKHPADPLPPNSLLASGQKFLMSPPRDNFEHMGESVDPKEMDWTKDPMRSAVTWNQSKKKSLGKTPEPEAALSTEQRRTGMGIHELVESEGDNNRKRKADEISEVINQVEHEWDDHMHEMPAMVAPEGSTSREKGGANQPSPATLSKIGMQTGTPPTKRIRRVAERMGYAAMGGATVGATIFGYLVYTAPSFA